MENTQFTQSGRGQMVFQAQKRCKNGTEGTDQTPKLKTLFGLKLTKILISRLLFILLKQMRRKRMQGDKKCANKQLRKLAIH